MSDRDVARQPAVAALSSRAVVTELFHHHYRRLVSLAALMVDDRESAEEVVQDAFEALYRHWPRLRDPEAAVVYLNRSVVNGSRSWVRRRVTEGRTSCPTQERSRRRRAPAWTEGNGPSSSTPYVSCPGGSAR